MNGYENKAVDGNVRQKREALIFEAAKTEFVSYGFNGASIKRIAERAQIPRSNIHYYFKDKTDLYQQLLNQILLVWNEKFDAFDEADDANINIKFTTIQQLHSDLNNTKENSITFADFENHEIVLLADEAHHLSSTTKNQADLDLVPTWENTVDKMAVDAAELMAWLGPAISQPSFEIGDEVRAAFMAHDPDSEACFVANPRGRWQGDLYALARQRLTAAGISEISGGGFCTYLDEDRFHSCRRDPTCGRMVSFVGRRPFASNPLAAILSVA